MAPHPHDPNSGGLQTPAPQSQAGTSRPLAGVRAWIISDGKAGMVVQMQGVADALGLVVETKTVELKGLARLMAPWGGVQRHDRFGQTGSAFAPPWPAIVIGTGRASIPYIRRLKRLAGPAIYTVVLLDPRAGPKVADLIWVPAHDNLRAPNVMTTVTSPHSYSMARLQALRAEMPPEIAALPGPRVSVILGGRNGVYRFTRADDDRLAGALKSLAALGASFMITPSRRSHASLIEAADRGTAGAPRIFWDGTGDNPYPHFLAHADALVVTADSVNMTGEACATGRPVWVFTPSGGSAKFDRFHAALRQAGATRPLPDSVENWQTWSYTPMFSAGDIAAEIERRWLRRQAMLGGLVVGRAPGVEVGGSG